MKKVALLSAILIAAPIAPAHADEESFTVMSRNIYLGADVGVALELIPNLPDAAQFMCVLLVTDKGANFVFVSFKAK